MKKEDYINELLAKYDDIKVIYELDVDEDEKQKLKDYHESNNRLKMNLAGLGTFIFQSPTLVAEYIFGVNVKSEARYFKKVFYIEREKKNIIVILHKGYHELVEQVYVREFKVEKVDGLEYVGDGISIHANSFIAI
jgi:effector-binding domain-containing protein